MLAQQPDVQDVRIAVACASLVVVSDPGSVGLPQIGAWLARAVSEPAPPAVARHAGEIPDKSAVVCGVAALGLSLIGAPALLATGFLAVSTVPVVMRAAQSLFAERQVSADALDATAITVLALRGDVVAAALSASLIAGGEFIRSLTARRSRGAVDELLASMPRFAWLVRDDRRERVPVEALAPGDTVVVYPGELVPVDGVVSRGEALVDQKVLTGESMPVLKQAGDAVYSSTVITDGKLYVCTERAGHATRASQIVQLLEEAPVHDTRLANYARRFADRLVLPTLLLAGGVYFVTRNLTRAIAVIVFDFATGLRVSAPTAVLAAMTAAARCDVLLKSGRALEQLAAVDTLVFDKTGTLTRGLPRVVDVQALAPGVTGDDVLALAAAAERRLTHPAAEAIVQAAEARALAIPERRDSCYTLGLGVRADVDGHDVLVGSERFLVGAGTTLPAAAQAQAEAAGRRGASTVFVAWDGQLIGAIAYADATRPEAKAMLARLRAAGIRRFIMVTGDNAEVAGVIAGALGIDRVEAEVFPERKAEIVRELQRAGHVVGVVGDGINDSPALAYADVAISLKAGTDVARETADVVLHGDLHGLPETIEIARESMGLIRQNLAIVGVPNGAGLVLAAAGFVNPVGATALNNGSNVLAALNALRPLWRTGGWSAAPPERRATPD